MPINSQAAHAATSRAIFRLSSHLALFAVSTALAVVLLLLTAVSVHAQLTPEEASAREKQCYAACTTLRDEATALNCTPIYSGCAMDVMGCGSRFCMAAFNAKWMAIDGYAGCIEGPASTYMACLEECNPRFRARTTFGEGLGILRDCPAACENAWQAQSRACRDTSCNASCTAAGNPSGAWMIFFEGEWDACECMGCKAELRCGTHRDEFGAYHANPGTELECTVTFANSDAQTLALQTWLNGHILLESESNALTSYTFPWTPDELGTNLFTAVVVMPDGTWCQSSRTIVVDESDHSSLPVDQELQLEPLAVSLAVHMAPDTPDRVEFTADANRDPGAELIYSWAIDGQFMANTYAPAWWWEAATPGRHTVTVVATAGEETARAEMAFLVKVDSDGDGVLDDDDDCPGTPPHTPVDAAGCPYPTCEESCTAQYGSNATGSGTPPDCRCDCRSGFGWNEQGTACVANPFAAACGQPAATTLWTYAKQLGYSECSEAEARATPGAIVFWYRVYTDTVGTRSATPTPPAGDPLQGLWHSTIVVSKGEQLGFVNSPTVTPPGQNPEPSRPAAGTASYAFYKARCPAPGSVVDEAAIRGVTADRATDNCHWYTGNALTAGVKTSVYARPGSRVEVNEDGLIHLDAGSLYGRDAIDVQIGERALRFRSRFHVQVGPDGAAIVHLFEGRGEYDGPSGRLVLRRGQTATIFADGTFTKPVAFDTEDVEPWWEAVEWEVQKLAAPEAAEQLPNGELLLADDFTSADRAPAALFGEEWMEFGLVDGQGRLAGSAHGLVLPAMYATPTVADFAAEFDFFAPLGLSDGEYGLIFRSDDARDGLDYYYAVGFSPAGGLVELKAWHDPAWGSTRAGDLPPGALNPGGFTHVRIEAAEDRFRVFSDGVLVLEHQDATLSAPGIFGLYMVPGVGLTDEQQDEVLFRSLRVYALGDADQAVAESLSDTAAPSLTPIVTLRQGDARTFTDPPPVIAYANDEVADPPAGVSIATKGEVWRYHEWLALQEQAGWIEAVCNGPVSRVGVQFWGDSNDGGARVFVDSEALWRGNTYGTDTDGFVRWLEITNLPPGRHTVRVQATGRKGLGGGSDVTVYFFGCGP